MMGDTRTWNASLQSFLRLVEGIAAASTGEAGRGGAGFCAHRLRDRAPSQERTQTVVMLDRAACHFSGTQCVNLLEFLEMRRLHRVCF